jgi:hypothetical protein
MRAHRNAEDKTRRNREVRELILFKGVMALHQENA